MCFKMFSKVFFLKRQDCFVSGVKYYLSIFFKKKTVKLGNYLNIVLFCSLTSALAPDASDDTRKPIYSFKGTVFSIIVKLLFQDLKGHL